MLPKSIVVMKIRCVQFHVGQIDARVASRRQIVARKRSGSPGVRPSQTDQGGLDNCRSRASRREKMGNFVGSTSNDHRRAARVGMTTFFVTNSAFLAKLLTISNGI